MNEQAPISAQSDTVPQEDLSLKSAMPVGERVRRAPKIVQSALFGLLFATALFITVIGALLSFSQDAEQVSRAYALLQYNLLLILALAIYLAYRVWINLFARGTRQSAPVLHRRFVMIFSFAALVPAVIVGGFTVTLLRQNISEIFGENVRTNMVQAQAILDDYVDQELEELGDDITSLKLALRQSRTPIKSRISYAADLQVFSRVREIDAIYVLGPEGFVLARAEAPGAPEFRVPYPAIFSSLTGNDIAFQKRDDSNYLIALAALDEESKTYLFLGQRLRSKSQVLSSISGIRDATDELARFNADQLRMNRIFGLTFLQTAILILMAAIWLGLVLASRIIDPLSGLIHAAERVRSGDMSTRVDVQEQWGEISDLSSAFNRMTQQLNTQRDALVREHDLAEQRRQFSEAVLSGVRAGVIGLDQTGKVTLLNESARRLLGERAEDLLTKPISEALPEFAVAFNKAREHLGGSAEDQVTMEIDETPRNYDLRVSAYSGARADTGWVLTFDDMTRLVSAQRHSAWREVARRIAHEIKNPLTPIQLSAERLARKFGPQITGDRVVFDQCTQTIIRQVGSLEQMVNEFSAFARMPSPEFAPLEVQGMLENVLFEQGVSFPEIAFPFTGELPKKCIARGDVRMLTQALNNIYKNAGEAVIRYLDAAAVDGQTGRISTDLSLEGDLITITIIDNGPGWPFPDTERLLEPYVTTRETGTGLGLAIVKRIAEDHHGKLLLTARTDGKRGACVYLRLPAFDRSSLEPIGEALDIRADNKPKTSKKPKKGKDTA